MSKKLTKLEKIDMLNQIIAIFDDVNKTLDELFIEHTKAQALENSKKA